jgi:hypothetical protein
MLKDQNPKDIQYMILTRWDEGKTKSGQKVERDFYIFPKHMPNTSVNDACAYPSEMFCYPNHLVRLVEQANL